MVCRSFHLSFLILFYLSLARDEVLLQVQRGSDIQFDMHYIFRQRTLISLDLASVRNCTND